MANFPVKTLTDVKARKIAHRVKTPQTRHAFRAAFADKLKQAVKNTLAKPLKKESSPLPLIKKQIKVKSLVSSKPKGDKNPVARQSPNVKQLLGAGERLAEIKGKKKDLPAEAPLEKSESAKGSVLAALAMEADRNSSGTVSKVKKNQDKNQSKAAGPGRKAANRSGGAELLRMGAPNLTSKAERVEVIDRRKFSAANGKGLRHQALRKEASADTVQNTAEAKFAVLETEIGVPKEPGIRQTDRSAAEALTRKLDGQAGGEIVRQVKVVLSRAEAGEIRISLRPENLGRVRVNIEMKDNRLTGRIFVESAAAREAFRANLDGLQTKLVESGFNAADLELSWDERSGDHPGADGQNHFAGKDESGNRKSAMREFEVSAARSIDDSGIDGRINMVV